ncbi:MAG: (Fe-S)-binding protein [Planctomycetales bacterium]|nr:(Fe-S)-binding protein [Planctomycetales bacterium]
MNANLTRPIYWNVEYVEPAVPVVGILLIAALAVGLHRRWKRWRLLGTAELRTDQPLKRLARVLKSGLGQRRVAEHKYAGAMHGLIFVGFTLLFIGTCLVAVERDIAQLLLGLRPVAFLKGSFYTVFSFVLDLAGVMVLVGCAMALVRRYVVKPSYLAGRPAYGFWVVLLLLVTLSGFYVEAARIAHAGFVIQGEAIVETEPTVERWASPVGYALAQLLPKEAVTPAVQHTIVWWSHGLLSLGFILGFAFGVMRHAITGLANIYFAPLAGSHGTLQPIPNMEEAESFGVTSIDQFSWKTLFNSDCCVSCGRCEINCPASITGKPLSPRRIMLSINKAWEEATDNLHAGKPIEEFEPIVDEFVSTDELWSCTTCGACMQQCPVSIEHIPAIVDLRRSLVMMESRFPEEAQLTLTNLENAGNPWGLDNESRADWGKDLKLPTIAEEPNPEVLFWVGCAGSFDVGAKPTSRALVKILNAAGVRFAILGSEERCCGDPARRIGHEYLYNILAEMAIETLNGYGVKKIVATCPHCLHTLLNEYPQLGGHYEVVHHTDYIAELIAAGRLSELSGEGGPSTVYHDSCYLGRHNGVYDSPRSLVRSAGLPLVEMQRKGAESFCCGAGGGRMWMEETLGDKKINIERSEEAIETGAQQIAVACPFCKTMMSDGVKEKGREDIQVQDIAVLLAEKLGE